MHTEKLSEIIAHFIGLFDTATEEAKMRNAYAEGSRPTEDSALPHDEEAAAQKFASDLELKDYDPSAPYRSLAYDINFAHPRFLGHAFEESIAKLNELAHRDLTGLHFTPQITVPGEDPLLPIYAGPGSMIAHVSQINILYDDDFLNLSDQQVDPRDTSFVTMKLIEYEEKAEALSPLQEIHRTDNAEALTKIADSMHDYIRSMPEASDQTPDGQPQPTFVSDGDADSPTYLYKSAGDDLSSPSYIVNGVATTTAPVLDDMMPDRGIAKPPADLEDSKSDTPQEEHGGPGNTLDIAAGANVLANIVQITDTSVISSVTAVMGNYHQIDAITQSYIYSDHDDFGGVFNKSQSAATVANNIASFQRSVYDDGGSQHSASTDDGHDPTFPTAWRVSVVNGDVSFVNWIEQYHFINDNDTMTITATGTDATVLTGGNSAVNFASMFGIGMQYDLVIVGGNVLDMNVISQISVLYDNDWARGQDGAPGATIQGGNNLIWNLAEIHNVGANDRFQAMPDYMAATQKAIEERDPSMPEGLAHDANFAGYAGLNVLYITGNLYDVNVIKQVSILGDSDDVTHVISSIAQNNQNATIHVDTGSNAVVNIAQIMDYDTIGHTTYLNGQLYSDAILIQSGLVEHDTTQPQQAPLANEAIAFLGNDSDQHASGSDDVTINGGHDYAWHLTHPDVMQGVTA
ncbi:hypothetical protein [Rhizobium sp. OAE497]|uniref:hypothetical protein n=1 Tax=Rhizobium sp. OAE497 TaxID=2663796 RepID=UPI0018F788F9